jgi:DNA-binding NarL/FixJ family response regulator
VVTLFVSVKEDRRHVMIKASIIIVDNHALFRKALRRIIREEPSLYVAYEAGDGLELLRLLEETTPDAVILDISMPRLSGLEAAAIIKQLYPGVKIVMLTMHLEKEYFYKAIEIGVEGYLIKQEIDDLNFAIKTVLEGKTYITPLFV